VKLLSYRIRLPLEKLQNFIDIVVFVVVVLVVVDVVVVVVVVVVVFAVVVIVVVVLYFINIRSGSMTGVAGCVSKYKVYFEN